MDLNTLLEKKIELTTIQSILLSGILHFFFFFFTSRRNLLNWKDSLPASYNEISTKFDSIHEKIVHILDVRLPSSLELITGASIGQFVGTADLYPVTLLHRNQPFLKYLMNFLIIPKFLSFYFLPCVVRNV